MPRFARGACVLAVALGASRPAAAAKIACVGDSITFGYNLSDPSTQSYPAVLGVALGKGDTVQNFGVSGATLLKSGDKPYWDQASFDASTSFAPDVVIIMLGTNDAKPQNWSKKAQFSADYADLISHYRSLGALVYVAAPPPVYPPGAYDIPPDVVANEVVPLVEALAVQANAPLIDVFTALSDKAQDFPDTVHPNAAGAALIADTVRASLDMYGLGGAGATAGAGGTGTAAGAGGMFATGTGGAPAAGSGNAGGGMAGASAASGSGPTAGGAPTAAGGATGAAGATMLGAGGSPATSGGTAGAARGGAGASSSGGGAPNAAAGASGAPRTNAAGTGGSGMPAAPGAAAEPSATPNSGASGCGCRASRSGSPARAALAFALAFVALGRRRRRAA